jgi:hypothetical protein
MGLRGLVLRLMLYLMLPISLFTTKRTNKTWDENC